MKKILVLGAGLVVKPIVDYFLSKNYFITVADLEVAKAEKIINNHPKGNAISLNVSTQPEKLDDLILNHDIVLNLLPPQFMSFVAEFCISNKKNLIGTNYLSPEMKNLDPLVEKAGITIIDEVGVDPGIDHMISKKIIDEIHAKKGKIISFRSYCGGLPAPESNTNPLGYKFSWSPRGALMASRRDAQFKENNVITSISGKDLFKKEHISQLAIDETIGTLEVYANSDSLKYISIYDIPEVETIYRSTLRYPGWSEILNALSNLNFLSLNLYDSDCTHAQFLARLINIDFKNIKKNVAEFLKISEESELISKLEWLGVFSKESLGVFDKQITPLDLLAKTMLKKMTFNINETDLLILINEFKVKFPDESSELIRVSLIEYGDEGGYSAMAKTVSYPVIACTELLLDKKVEQKGIFIPTIKEIYEPVLKRLEEFGLNFDIKKTPIN